MPRQAVHHFPLRYLLIPPVLLALLTAATLYQHSDTNIYMLYSQCHARSRLPILSHTPLVGTPSCFLVSFFLEALTGLRAKGTMSIVLSSIASLFTVSTVEAARICNSPSVLIAYPTGPWLVFNMLGGAIVWELVIIPAFFHRSREIITARERGMEGGLRGAEDPVFGEAMRHLTKSAETVAIPVAVGLGCIVPSVVMLLDPRPATVLVWLFFPLWVSAIRMVVRRAVVWWQAEWHGSFHLESSRVAMVGMYALPFACSVAAHGVLVWSLTQRDDRREMTRATLKFIVIDLFFIGLTVLYWLLVEAGWRVVLVMVGTSLVLGPGAGICVGWVYREASVNPDKSVTVVAVGARPSSGEGASEETPLLR